MDLTTPMKEYKPVCIEPLSGGKMYIPKAIVNHGSMHGHNLRNLFTLGYPFTKHVCGEKRVIFVDWKKRDRTVKEIDVKKIRSDSERWRYIENFGFDSMIRDWPNKDKGIFRACSNDMREDSELDKGEEKIPGGRLVKLGLDYLMENSFVGELLHNVFYENTWDESASVMVDRLHRWVDDGPMIDLNYFCIMCASIGANIEHVIRGELDTWVLAAEDGIAALVMGECHICAQLNHGVVLSPFGCERLLTETMELHSTCIVKGSFDNNPRCPSVKHHILYTIWGDHDSMPDLPSYVKHKLDSKEHMHVNRYEIKGYDQVIIYHMYNNNEVVYQYSNLMARILVAIVTKYQLLNRRYADGKELYCRGLCPFTLIEINMAYNESERLGNTFHNIFCRLMAIYLSMVMTERCCVANGGRNMKFYDAWLELLNDWYEAFRNPLVWTAYIFRRPVVYEDSYSSRYMTNGQIYFEDECVYVNQIYCTFISEVITGFMETGKIPKAVDNECYDGLSTALRNHRHILPCLFYKKNGKLIFSDHGMGTVWKAN